MQRLIRNNSIILMGWSPFIEIARNEIKVAGKTFLRRTNPASFQHCRIQIETVDDEIRMPRRAEVRGQAYFQVAIAGSDADKSGWVVLCTFTMLSQIFSKHVIRAAETQCFELWSHVLVRPVMKYIGQIVDVNAVPVNVVLYRQASCVSAAGVRALRRLRWPGHVRPIFA